MEIAIKHQKPRSRWISWLDILIFLTLVLAVLIWQFPVFGTKLYTPVTRSKCGSVPAGTELYRQFVIRNLHPWPVTIMDVTGTCGCTRSFADKKVPFQLNSMAQVTVNVSVDTTGMRGKVAKSVFVATQSDGASATFVLEGEVRPKVP